MRYLFLFSLAFLVSFNCAVGQTDGLQGYGSTQWGMSPSEVLSAESEARKVKDPSQYPNYYAPIEASFEEPVFNVKVIYQFKKGSDSLTQVVLEPSRNSELAFKVMTRQLVRKYGAPTFQRGQQGTERESIWRFPTTTIYASYDVENSIVRVIYSPTIRGTTKNY